MTDCNKFVNVLYIHDMSLPTFNTHMSECITGGGGEGACV